MSASREIARFALGLRSRDLPEPVAEQARLHLLDAIGCAVAAVGLGVGDFGTGVAQDAPGGPASAVGVAQTVDAPSAALANGIACHALDFDDTHAASIAHVSAVVVPAALAAAEEHGADGDELLTALVAGNEVTCAVGLPVGDGFHLRGFHPTAICGVFGATVAVARIAGLSEDRTVHALGVAGSMAGGLLAFLSDGSSTKRLHPGWMAHAAHFAVRLAANGATGPEAVLEGRNGVYAAFLGRHDVVVPTERLGREWQTPLIAIKPYAACHFLHAAVDATAIVCRDEGLTAAGIARITVFAPQAGIEMVLAPEQEKRRPRSAYEAKFSAQFAIGALLAEGRVDVTTFTERLLADDAVLRETAKVDYVLHDYATFPGAFPGGVRIETVDGRVHEHHLDHQRGAPEYPMTADEIVQKYRDNATVGLATDDVDRLERSVLTLGRADGSAGVDPGPLRRVRRSEVLA